MRLHALASVAAIAASGCATTLSEHLTAGRFEDAWATTCPWDADPPTALEKVKLRAELEARTRIELRGDAMSGTEVNERLGAEVLPGDVALVQLRVDVIDVPGSYVAFEPRGLSAPNPVGAWHGYDLWKLAELDPGSSPRVTFSPLGLLADATLAFATGGLSLFPDPNFRDVKVTGESRPGNASPAQSRALELLTQLDRHPTEDGRFVRDLDDSIGASSHAECRASLDEPCEWVVVLSPDRRRSAHHLDGPITLAQLSSAKDALVFRWAFDHPYVEHCRLLDETVAELPAGASLSARIDALFAAGPLRVGQARVSEGSSR